MAAGSSPTVRRRRLGMELRRLREAAGLSLDDAGERLERTGATISRIELGRVGVRARDVEALLDRYGVTDPQTRETLVAMARASKQKGWWHAYSDVSPAWFEVYVGLEAAAASIRTYEAKVVPGILQTEAYARALFHVGQMVDAPEKIERQVELRMTRQQILTGDSPTQLWAILDEAVLRRQVGGSEVLRGQLQHLLDVSALSNVTLQILPFTAGAHPGMSGCPFVLFQFPEAPADPDIVYLEYQMGGLYLEKAEEVRRYTLIFDHLRAAGLSPDESAALIAKAVKDY